jgi:hypothetical protein
MDINVCERYGKGEARHTVHGASLHNKSLIFANESIFVMVFYKGSPCVEIWRIISFAHR